MNPEYVKVRKTPGWRQKATRLASVRLDATKNAPLGATKSHRRLFFLRRRERDELLLELLLELLDVLLLLLLLLLLYVFHHVHIGRREAPPL